MHHAPLLLNQMLFRLITRAFPPLQAIRSVAKGRVRKMRAVSVAIFALALIACGSRVTRCTVQMIFGDSLIDVGNNDYLTKSLARAALPWYGIDLGVGLPTGRFTNGRTVADIVGDDTGLPRPPAFLDPSLDVDAILRSGVNFASGGGGILSDTASLFIQRLSLYKQIELFRGTQKAVAMKIGEKAAEKFFKEARYVIAMGSNDFINNYLFPAYSSSWTHTDSSFIRYLMTTLDSQLKLLYELGARELYVFGLGPLGCIPLQRILSSSGGCSDRANALSRAFNKAAAQLVRGLAGALPNATILFGDPYDIVLNMVNNPVRYGLNNSADPCCALGNIRPTLICTPLSTLCSDRTQFLFWDEYHPTDKANEIIAKELIRQLGLKPIDHP